MDDNKKPHPLRALSAAMARGGITAGMLARSFIDPEVKPQAFKKGRAAALGGVLIGGGLHLNDKRKGVENGQKDSEKVAHWEPTGPDAEFLLKLFNNKPRLAEVARGQLKEPV
jgi:hypothetical protein